MSVATSLGLLVSCGHLYVTTTSMDLDLYLKRINFNGEPGVNLPTLREIQRQHLLQIPYEDLDVQLGRRLDFDTKRIFNKIVEQNRGGWCYEMNGLLGWALEELGFDVVRHSGASNREKQGEKTLGTHLLLEVKLNDVSYLTDVGFGDGLHFPVPITEDTHNHNGFAYGLEQMQDGYWRMHNHPHASMSSFDFSLDPALDAEEELRNGCNGLQDDPNSPFRQMLIAFRHTQSTIESLLGKTAITITPSGRQEHTLNTQQEVQQDLATRFGLHEDISPAWDQIELAHQRFLDYLAKKKD